MLLISKAARSSVCKSPLILKVLLCASDHCSKHDDIVVMAAAPRNIATNLGNLAGLSGYHFYPFPPLVASLSSSFRYSSKASSRSVESFHHAAINDASSWMQRHQLTITFSILLQTMFSVFNIPFCYVSLCLKCS